MSESASVRGLTVRFRGNPWGIVIVVSLAYFMAQLDALVLTLALPAMAKDFHSSLDQMVWALSVYVLVLAASLITSGRLGDLYGRRTMFLAGLALFTVSSLASGLSQSPTELIAARAFQGLGAALVSPQTLALLVDHIPKERRGAALGVRGAVGGFAAVAGPVVGGLLVWAVGWRWVFFVNVPVGVAAFIVACLVIPGKARGEQRRRLDLVGAALVSAGLVCFTLAVNQGRAYHWDGRVWLLFLGAALLGLVFVAQQRRVQQREPLVPFTLFHDRSYSLMNVSAALITFTFAGLVLILSVFLQTVTGFSAIKAGLVIMPASLFSMLFDPVAGRLSDKIGGRVLLLGGLAVTVVGIGWMATLMRAGADWPPFIAPMCVIGLGNAFLFTPLGAVALRDVKSGYAGAASGVLVTALQVGSMIGTAVSGALLEGAAGSVPTASAARTAMLLLVGAAAVAAITCAAARPKRQHEHERADVIEPLSDAVPEAAAAAK